jgi:hypothetical protein
MIFNRLMAIVMIAGMFVSPAAAQEKGAVREGFSTESLKGQKILLFRPSVWVGEQSTGGMNEPNGDWTAQSRTILTDELRRRQADFSNEVVAEPDLSGEDATLFASHKALFGSVADSVVQYQFFVGNRLPTRKNKAFDWTLGEGTKRIADLTGARYALFVTTFDSYGSAGRKALQVFAALARVSVTSGVHKGYAGLVDLQTGELVWLNADEQMGGDVRNEEGMRKRVSQLLEDFPGLRAQSQLTAKPQAGAGGSTSAPVPAGIAALPTETPAQPRP